MSNIITARNLLVARLTAAGLTVEQGFMAQHIQKVGEGGLICLQPANEPAINIGSQNEVGASRRFNLVLAVLAGPGQLDAMDTLLLSLRRALLKDNRLKQLAPGNHFDLPDGVDFFLPEGADHLFCAEQPITLKYRDEL